MAVLVASLLGSLHCVGMCGPLALWATGGGMRHRAVVAYHLGRLTTYWSAGLAAGVLGSAVSIGGELAGYQSLAAKVAGFLLVIVGVVRLASLHPMFRPAATAGSSSPSRLTALLHAAKPMIAGRGPAARAYLGGLLTTWLPCGWLYLFVLVAAGTGNIASALLVMTAFWLGTLPALTTLVFGARTLIPRFRTALPIAASVLLIVTGLYTATGRAAADLSSMVAPQDLVDDPSPTSLVPLKDEPLPCCQVTE
jgi:sulfite exporter TauE/SafE